MFYEILAFLLAGVFCCALQAQKPAREAAPAQTAADSDATRILVDVTRVNVLFTVTDKKGRFITDLARDDFQVIENKKPQSIMEFTAESDLPLRLAILVDTSNSVRDRFRFIQEAAVEFINGVLRPREDRALVVQALTPRPSWFRTSTTTPRSSTG